ncbi:hypothetical protein AO888_20325 [Pseudomonas aeruginosa]|nr:hypothetical protein [Pseudomonas aeruginosa]KSC70528.1 hypothetical protein AO888_20325 [Pseudomonas aeruginosa]
MSADLLTRFKQYRLSVDLERIRLSAVPDELQPLVKAYREALNRQLADPENESWGSLGPNERHNALQEVYLAFAPKVDRPKGNCPRCGGTGHILAYSHVRGGICLKCEGSGNVKPTLGVLERYQPEP